MLLENMLFMNCQNKVVNPKIIKKLGLKKELATMTINYLKPEKKTKK